MCQENVSVPTLQSVFFRHGDGDKGQGYKADISQERRARNEWVSGETTDKELLTSKINKNNQKTRRGKKRNNTKENKSDKLVLIGSNAAGIKAKADSLREKVNTFHPGCIFIQETKMISKGTIKYLPEYQIFEHVRKESKGGGLMTAVDKSFDSVLIYEGDDDIELLVVQGKVNNTNIRFVNGYGPQEDDRKVPDFYTKLEEEIGRC